MSSPNRNKYPKGGGHLSPGMFQPLPENRSDHLCRLKDYWYDLGDGSYSKSCRTRSPLNAFDDQRKLAGLAGSYGTGLPEPPPCPQTLALEISLRAATSFIHSPPYVEKSLGSKERGQGRQRNSKLIFPNATEIVASHQPYPTRAEEWQLLVVMYTKW